MAFTFTTLPDWAFDQTLSFTLQNIFKDNQQNVKDSYDIEHEFDEGDHNRISEGPNLIINSDAKRGNQFWWDGGAAADYNTPGSHDDQALSYGAANFSAQPDTHALAYGSFWTFAASAVWTADLSERIDIQQGVNLTLSIEDSITNYVAGSAWVDIVCYDAAGKYQGIICQIQMNSNEPFWTKHEATGTTLANGVGGATADTAYIRIRKYVGAAADLTFRVTRIKNEEGSTARFFSDDASKSQYLSARRTSDNGTQTLTSTVLFNVIFENPTADSDVFDDPGSDRYSTGTGYFTANRYMKLRASCALGLASAAWNANTKFDIDLYKTPLGGGEVFYARLAEVLIDSAITNAVYAQGSTLIELNTGDVFRIRATQDSGGNKTLLNASRYCYLDIEEI